MPTDSFSKKMGFVYRSQTRWIRMAFCAPQHNAWPCPGVGTDFGAGGGGGFSGNGDNGDYSGGGFSFLEGGAGGYGAGGGDGGFGGGGGAFCGTPYGAGGGGGGYSGGGSGGGGTGFGGGGGSIIGSSAIVDLAEVSGIASPDDSPNGEVIITQVPEPSTRALIGLGLSARLVLRRRKAGSIMHG